MGSTQHTMGTKDEVETGGSVNRTQCALNYWTFYGPKYHSQG